VTEAEKRIDEALDKVLRASGTALRYYTAPITLERLRTAMREVMSDSYINGSNDAWAVVLAAQRGKP